jgi:transketolase N-terminal domain/subunit
MYPNGRTSHRFKNALRRRVTIVDKNKQTVDGEVKDITEVDEAEG